MAIAPESLVGTSLEWTGVHHSAEGDGEDLSTHTVTYETETRAYVTVDGERVSETGYVFRKLDDEVYTRVVAMSGFIQQEPDEGAQATEKTEAWVFFDDDNIYISARCWDSHP